MHTDISYLEKLFIGYIQNELTQDQKAELKHLLSINPENKKLFFEMEEAWALAHYPKFESEKKANFDNCIKSNIHPLTKIHRYTFRPWNVFLKIAVVILLITTCTFSYKVWIQDQSGITSQPIIVFTPKGAQSAITLPDKTKVWLNSDSKLTYHTNFGTKRREIWLEGEAFFEVTPNKQLPFLVNASGIDILVTGTSFNVRNYKNDNNVSVALITGNVNVSKELPNIDSKKTLTLHPKQLLTFNKKNQTISTQPMNSLDNIAWRKGIFKFKAWTFEQIAKELERIYNVSIEIHSNALRKETFSGSFSNEQSIDSILQEINIYNKYKYVKEGNSLIITEK